MPILIWVCLSRPCACHLSVGLNNKRSRSNLPTGWGFGRKEHWTVGTYPLDSHHIEGYVTQAVILSLELISSPVTKICEPQSQALPCFDTRIFSPHDLDDKPNLASCNSDISCWAP